MAQAFNCWSRGPGRNFTADQIPGIMASLQPVGPDASLIEACLRFAHIELARQETPETLQAGQGIGDPGASGEQERLLDLICQIAARTFDGLQGKALAIVAWDPTLLDQSITDSYVTSRILTSLLRDMLS